MSHEGHKVEFTLPKGFQAPEGIGEGETFSMVCDFQLKEGGQACLVKMGDAPMPGYDDEEKGETKHKPDYKDYASRMGDGQMPVNQPGTGY